MIKMITSYLGKIIKKITKLSKREQEVLNKNDPNSSYYYCLMHSEIADVSAHEKIILTTTDCSLLYNSALSIHKLNKEKLFERLLELNNVAYIKLFLMNVKFHKEKYEGLLLFL